MTIPSNFFSGLPAALPDELFTTLLDAGNFRIERIVSHGHASPEGFWYDQEQHEWVVVLKGAARLRFEEDGQAVEMKPGDFVNVRAHEKHRVEWTTPDEPTVWLAVHYGERVPKPVPSAISGYLKDRPSQEELSKLALGQSLPGSQNSKFFATTSPRLWFVKVCRNYYQRAPEVCEREALASLLGRTLGVSIMNAWAISTSLLSINLPTEKSDKDLILDRVVMMDLVMGKTVQDDQVRAAQWVEANGARVADIFAFMHWIGDEDRGLSDVMLDPTGLVLIDNGLCGPGQNDKLRGYHPTPEVYTPDRILLKCYGGGKPSFVEFVLKIGGMKLGELRLPGVIPKIAALSLDDLREIIECVGVPENNAQVLYERGQNLSEDYAKWFDEAISYCLPQHAKC